MWRGSCTSSIILESSFLPPFPTKSPSHEPTVPSSKHHWTHSLFIHVEYYMRVVIIVKINYILTQVWIVKNNCTPHAIFRNTLRRCLLRTNSYATPLLVAKIQLAFLGPLSCHHPLSYLSFSSLLFIPLYDTAPSE